MTADMPERYVIETTCPNCGHVAKSETSVEALSKARDWARNRSFEGVLPEIAATPSVCALERAGAARCTPELVEAETHWPTDGSGDEFDGGYDPTVERNPRLPGEKDTRPRADGTAINVRLADAVRDFLADASAGPWRPEDGPLKSLWLVNEADDLLKVDAATAALLVNATLEKVVTQQAEIERIAKRLDGYCDNCEGDIRLDDGGRPCLDSIHAAANDVRGLAALAVEAVRPETDIDPERLVAAFARGGPTTAVTVSWVGSPAALARELAVRLRVAGP